MKRIQKLRLDIHKEDSFNIVNFKQGDTGDLIISVYEDNKAIDVSEQIVRFYAKKPDNTFVEQTTNISTIGNVVTVNLDEQVLTAEGRAYGELSFSDRHGKMTSSSFLINIGEQKVNIDDLIQSDSSVSVLDEVRQFIEQAKADMQEYKDLVAQYSAKLEELDTSAQAIITKLSEVNVNMEELTNQNNLATQNIQAIKDATSKGEGTRNAIEQLIKQANRVKQLHEAFLNDTATPAKEELERKVEEANQVKLNLEGLKTQLDELVNNTNTVIENANNTKASLEGVDATAKQTHTQLEALVEEAKVVIGQVQAFIDRNSVTEDVNQLKTDMTQVKGDIQTLTTNLDKKVDKEVAGYIGNGEEITGLASFGEAVQTGHYRILAGVDDGPGGVYEKDDLLIVFNAEKDGKGSIYQKIVGHKQYERIGKHTVNILGLERTIQWRPWKEVTADSGASNVDLSDYYNKAKVDNLLSKKLDREPVGIIGNNPLPDVYSGLSSIIDREFLSQVKGVLAYNSNKKDISQGTYCLVLFGEMPGEGDRYVNTFKYSDGSFGYLSTNISSVNSKCYKKSPGGDWRTESSPLDSGHKFSNMEVYALNFNLENRDNKGEILVYGEPIPKMVNDYNSATENGSYSVTGVASHAPTDTIEKAILEVTSDENYIYQEYHGEMDYKRRYANSEWTPWQMIDMQTPEGYSKQEVDIKIHKSAINVESVHESIPNHGLVSSVEAGYKNPLWDEIPADTYKNVPANPNPTEYKWFMKCTHYNYHMVFYFKDDPTDKIAVYEDEKGKKFKWLDPTFTYDKYKGWHKSSNTSTSWTAFSNDNHFASTTRIINAMYGHNFNLMNANVPGEIFYRGIAENPDEVQDSVTSFNTAINKKYYEVRQEAGEHLEGAPREGEIHGILEVQKVGNKYKQILSTKTNEKFERVFADGVWSTWSKNTQEEIVVGALYSSLDGLNKDELIKGDDFPETLDPENPITIINNGNIIVEHGEYFVDEANNSALVEDNTREFTDIIPLSTNFKKVLGCTIEIDRLDLHYNFYINANIVPIIEAGVNPCARLYITYIAPDAIKKADVWNPQTGLRKIKYTIIGC